jgi:hypothetical protein
MGALETPARWDGQIVCAACHATLSDTDFSHLADEVFRDVPLSESELVHEQTRRIAHASQQLLRIPCPLCKTSIPKNADHCAACGWKKHTPHGFDIVPAWTPPTP